MKKLLLVGGTGFIGQYFARAYHKAFLFTFISTRPKRAKKLFPKAECYGWDKLLSHGFIDQFDIVLNLSGAGIADKRWSNRRKRTLFYSRVDTTEKLVRAILNAKSPPRLLNASAIGVYGFNPIIKQQMITCFSESSDEDVGVKSFAKSLVKSWEDKLMPLHEKGLPAVCLRFGVILGPNGGALKKMLRPYAWGLGGPVGKGSQPVSWCHISDCVRAIYFIMMHPDINGPVNIVAPDVVTNKRFSQSLAKQLGTSAYCHLPYWFVRIVFGEMGKELLLNGQYVVSRVLQENGFKFLYPQLRQALAQLLPK